MSDRIKALALLSSLQKHRADDYDTWIKVGMALHNAGANCADWDNWSKQSSKYESGVCERKWKSFTNFSGTPITIATLVQFAKEDGYTREERPALGRRWTDVSHPRKRRQNLLAHNYTTRKAGRRT